MFANLVALSHRRCFNADALSSSGGFFSISQLDFTACMSRWYHCSVSRLFSSSYHREDKLVVSASMGSSTGVALFILRSNLNVVFLVVTRDKIKSYVVIFHTDPNSATYFMKFADIIWFFLVNFVKSIHTPAKHSGPVLNCHVVLVRSKSRESGPSSRPITCKPRRQVETRILAMDDTGIIRRRRLQVRTF